MITDYLIANWEEPPQEMGFEGPYGQIYEDLVHTVERVIKDQTRKSPPLHLHDDILALYLKTQIVPRLFLTYKISIEFGLALVPGTFFDLQKIPKDPKRYSQSQKQEAQRLYEKAIRTARLIYRLEPESPHELWELYSETPPFLFDLMCINQSDKYTWRASNPKVLKNLAYQIGSKGLKIKLVLGAAHGCIRGGLYLAELLKCDLYFLRYSLFKREDKAPVLSDLDSQFLSAYQLKPVLLFDEDVARGKTLGNFVSLLKPRFERCYSAAALRHYLASFRPEFVGETFYD